MPSRLAPLLVLVPLMLVAGCGGESETATPLHCYVGGTMRPAMEKLAAKYEAETGQTVDLDFGGSGENLIRFRQTGRGDLYVAHDPFHGALLRAGETLGGWDLASLRPMIAVPKGNPKEIRGLADLAKPGVKVVLTDPEYSTTGHIYRVMFGKAGLADEIEANVVTRTRGGGAAANQVALGAADAALVWNAVIHLRDPLEAVDVAPAHRPQSEVDAVTTATYGPIDMSHIKVTIDILSSTDQAEAARAFAEFCASKEAEAVWRDFGFTVTEGEKALPASPGAEAAARAPKDASLHLYCGAGLRPAVDALAEAFTRAGGPPVEIDYGGSGMIIARLRTARRGDLFLPGDVGYVELAEAEGLVASKTPVAVFTPVIMVPKGNPAGITRLADLARPGVRLGLGNPEACQIGRLSARLWPKNDVDPAAVAANLVYASATVNELGVQIKTGHLDAAIVWQAVAAQYPDDAQVVPIPPAQNILSQVAVAVLTTSTHPEAAEAFVAFLTGPDGRALLAKHGYRPVPPRA